MKSVRRLFWIAGVYGLAVILPQFFLLDRIGSDYPPAITHPEYFYGFLGVATAWQLAFLVIAHDPLRFRPMIVPSALEKLSFAAAVAALYWQGRAPAILCGFAAVDLLFGLLFIMAFVRIGRYS